MVAENLPLVSVIVCTYNQEHTISQTLDGILMQNVVSYEIILGEDCSTDGTRAICERYAQQHPGKIRLMQYEKNIGAFENFKACIRAAKGKYAAFCAGDDYWTHPGKLAMQSAFLESHPNHSMVHTRFHVLNSRSGELEENVLPPWDPADKNQFLPNGNFVGGLTVMMQMGILKQAVEDRLFDLGFMMEDYPLWIYATEKAELGFLNVFTSVWRLQEESLSNTEDVNKRMRFELSFGDIREYMAKRRGVFEEMKPLFAETYKRVFYRAYDLGNNELQQQAFKKIKEYGVASWRNYLYAQPACRWFLRTIKQQKQK